MVAAQVDARDRADPAEPRDGAGEPMRGNADAHPALHDRQQRSAADHELRQSAQRGCVSATMAVSVMGAWLVIPRRQDSAERTSEDAGTRP